MSRTPEELDLYKIFLMTQNTARMPDFTIIVKGHSFHVHSSVISKYSQFFSKASQGDFKETAERSISLNDEELADIARLLIWCYTGRLVQCFRNPCSGVFVWPSREDDPVGFLKNSQSIGSADIQFECAHRLGFGKLLDLYDVADKFIMSELCSDIINTFLQLVDQDWYIFKDACTALKTSKLPNKTMLWSGLAKWLATNMHELTKKDVMDLCRDEPGFAEMVIEAFADFMCMPETSDSFE